MPVLQQCTIQLVVGQKSGPNLPLLLVHESRLVHIELFYLINQTQHILLGLPRLLL